MPGIQPVLAHQPLQLLVVHNPALLAERRLDYLDHLRAEIESDEIQGFVAVALTHNGQIYRNAEFEDGLTLLGALDYFMAVVRKGMNNPED